MQIVFLVFDGFQVLDLTGPAAVFSAAADAGVADLKVVTVSLSGGLVRSSAGIAVDSAAIADVRVESGGSLFVVGGEGEGLRRLMADAALAAWFRTGSEVARRYGSICTGAFALAAWGLVDGMQVATHWRGARQLARQFPKVKVDPEAMFVEAGRLWTSAGVTAGIDMALGMVERDHGATIASAIAQRLVLSVRRPGRQSQFSPLIRAQAGGGGRYAELIGHIAAHVGERLDVESLAVRAGESPRSFQRNFVRATGKTPAAFVTAARLDRARILLGQGAAVKEAAAACGFSSPEHLSKSFSGTFGVSPAAWRTMNATASAPSRR